MEAQHHQIWEKPWCIKLSQFKIPLGRQMVCRQQNISIILRSPINWKMTSYTMQQAWLIGKFTSYWIYTWLEHDPLQSGSAFLMLFLQFSYLWAYSISAHGPCARCGYFSSHNQKNPLKLKFVLTILVILVLFKPKPRAPNKANPASHAEPRIHKLNSTFQLGASYWSLQLSKFTVIITYVENSSKNCFKRNYLCEKVRFIH